MTTCAGWIDPQLIPCYLATLSALWVLLWTVCFRPDRPNDGAQVSANGSSEESPLARKLRIYTRRSGGTVIWTLQALRFVVSAVLLILASVRFSLEALMTDDLAPRSYFGCAGRVKVSSIASYAYVTILHAIVLAVHHTTARTLTYNGEAILLAQLCILAWRNIWPLMQFDRIPADSYHPALIWTELVFLTVAAVIIPAAMPNPYVPLDPLHPSPPPAEQTASFASIISFCFMDPFIYRSYFGRNIPYDTLPPLADYDKSSILEIQSRDLMDPWQRRQMSLESRHLFFGLMEFLGVRLVWQAVIIVINVIATFLGPIAINRLLGYLETGGQGATIRPWVWIVLIFLSRILFSAGENGYLYVTNRAYVHTENILLQLIFAQALRMRILTSSPKGSAPASSATSVLGGSNCSQREGNNQTDIPDINVNTLIGADVPSVLDGREFVFFFIQLPLEVVSSVWFLTAVLGWSAVLGMLFLVMTLPLPGLLTNRIAQTQKIQMEKTDERVKSVTETLNILRMVKMFAWEPMVKKRIQEKRRQELGSTRKRRLLELVVGNLNVLLPVTSMIITYGAYTLLFGYDLNASIVFSSMSIFDLLRMDLVAITRDLNFMINAKVSLDRIDHFLREAPLLDEFELNVQGSSTSNCGNENNDTIGFHDASFTWTPSRAVVTPGRNFRLTLDGDVIFKRGAINLVTGPTGCGKTSILMALLGEMYFDPIMPDGWYNLPRKKGIAFAAQESWVMNETIKNNILFGSPYDEKRYRKTIEQCALIPDLALLAAGDNTEVGEKGLTLSGGQKARITLARAVYSMADILLLDDILSALDVHTSRWIVEKCLQGDLVYGRTVILATHAVAIIRPIAQNIIDMDWSGRVRSQGPPMENSSNLTRAGNDNDAIIQAESVPDALDEKPGARMDNGQLVIEEERAEGRVRWAALELMLNAYGGLIFWIPVVSTFCLAMLADVMTTWWLGIWTSSYETHSAAMSTAWYLAVFVAFTFSQTALTTMGTIGYVYRSMRACHKIHGLLMKSVLSSTMRWIDTTPRGRIIARFTQDIRDVDGPLSQWLIVFLSRTLQLLFKFSAVMVSAPILLIPGLAIALLAYGVGRVYLHVQMALKRLRSNWKSPIYNHFSAAITGLVSIRAYGAQDQQKQEFFKRLDAYSRPSRSFQNLHRWIAARVDALGALFATGVATYLVYFKRVEAAGQTGFSLNMAIGFAGMILWWLRTANNMEVTANSLERIRDYIEIDHEPEPSDSGKPPAYWPASGALRVENLSARYAKDAPLVLQDISFSVKSGERIGIVGRTGSGKSTLALSLLRMILTTGEVYLDGLPTSRLNLDALRSNLTIIPQEPVLLSGTLRTNLDPFSQQDDMVLNDALRATGLLSRGDDSLSLDTVLSDAGSNFSVGERQLIAISRAIVRNTRILMLDEATASVDHKSDMVIQESIRRELKGATLLTIAHRLRTIMDYDKIMVLDSGRLVEFDTPVSLLAKDGGYFRGLVEESGDRDELKAIALQSAHSH